MLKYRHALILLFPFVFAGCFKTREEIAREKEDQEVRSNLQQNIVEYNSSIEKAHADISRLTGRVEELEHKSKKEMGGLATSREADQKTIEELKTKVAALQEAQNALFEEIKHLKEESINAGEASKPTRVAAPAAKKGKAPPYESSVAAYKAKDYATAGAGFRAYLEANPRGKHALDARFYLADCFYKQKDYEQAVVEFGVVHEKSPSSSFGRKSTLRLAQSFKAMGKPKDAKAFAQLLVQSSPDSEEAKAARKLLK